MADDSSTTSSIAPRKAQHLCVLVHGLWGNASHLNYAAQALRDQYSDEELIVLVAQRNSGSFTYDGIDLGAERVAKEIEDKLEELTKDGQNITKFSIMGYSLGGLVARYAIGLLHHNGFFNNIVPVNFTTFATPHLGVRTPLLGYSNKFWNILGSRTLSTSGRQLFLIDKFRDTERPLLGILADPDSIFIRALALFKYRSLYTNIINDRSAVYYTTGVSRVDPFVDLDKIDLQYLEGYEPIILDPQNPFNVKTVQEKPSLYQRVTRGAETILRQTPFFLALTVLLPIATVAFLINSSIQTFRSQRRILLHETNLEGHGFGMYRIPYMVQEMRVGLEDAFENVNSAQRQEYLPETSNEGATYYSRRSGAVANEHVEPPNLEKSNQKTVKRTTSIEKHREFPTLALTSTQFNMIQTLDDVGFRKYLVHIHKSRHSHAAIIVRHPRAAFDDGKVVVQHWLEQNFVI